MRSKMKPVVLSCILAPIIMSIPAVADVHNGDGIGHFSDGTVESRLKLEKIEVFGERSNSEQAIPTGTFSFVPRLVVEVGTRKTANHASYGIVIRPIIEGDNGLYELDTTRGRTHYTVNSGLPKRSRKTKIAVRGTKRFTPVDQFRTLELPEGLYAISEVYFIVIRGPSPTFTTVSDVEAKRYCLSETTLSFEVKAGEATTLDRLYLRGLPFKSKKWRDHNPIFGTDKGLEQAGKIKFTKEDAEGGENWMPVAFDADSGMCRSQFSVRTTGWDLPDPEAWGLPHNISAELD